MSVHQASVSTPAFPFTAHDERYSQLMVSRNLVLVDSTIPLPQNLEAWGIRFVEATLGRDHHRHFRAYLAGGGIPGLLETAALPLTITHRAVICHACREVVVAASLQYAD